MDSDRNKTLANWAGSHSAGVALASINALASAGAVREFLTDRRTRAGLFATEPTVDERQWLKFYNSPKLLERGIAQAFLGGEADQALDLMNALRNPARASERNKQAAARLVLGFFAPRAPEEWVQPLGQLLADDEPLAVEEFPDDLAVAFYFWVHAPCWLVYGRTPTAMMKTVSAGGVAAEPTAHRLVRIDHRASRHPAIQRWVQQDRALSKFRNAKIQKWMRQAPFDKEKSDSLALRRITGYVSSLSKLLDEPLETPELRGVIEALGPNVPADMQAYLLDRTDDDFGRETRRHRDHFEQPSKPDKSTFESVRAILRSLE